MKTLLYFVDDISSSFVLNDINKFSNNYDKIVLFSSQVLTHKFKLPLNVLVIENYINWKNFNPKKLLFINLFTLIKIYFKECFYLKKILPLKPSFSLLVSNIFKAENIQKHLDKTNSYCAYSFWFYDTVFLAWMKMNNNISCYFSRAHGGDLFEERSSLNGKILLRNFQLKYINKVFSVSRKGTQYLQSKYPIFKNKINTSYLGSPNHNHQNELKFSSDFIIVSCAKVRDIKRIHKIAESLSSIKFNLTWYHIGDENLDEKNDSTIKDYILAKKKIELLSNIKFFPLGHLNNEEVFSFYNSNQINLFISLSEAEGIPVSMMEAISFGIPILSTDVGGCKEIVTKKTGILIPLNTEINEVAKIITDFKNSNLNTSEFRKGVRKFWEENFDIDVNYANFFKTINE